ncbi:MAG TPA: hypothetical protein VFF79_12690 [Conexibacter sp.]|nr:hypothetical protein [Conexibacter sp.]
MLKIGLGRHVRRNAVAYVALFISLGSTSVAALRLPANSVGTRQLKNQSVTRSKLSATTLRSLVGKTGPPGPEGVQGPPGVPGAPAQSLWAIVSSDGALLESSGALSITASGNLYGVVFDRDVSHCARSATLGFPNGVVFHGGAPSPGEVFVAGSAALNPAEIDVYTFSSTGASQPRPFDLSIAC